MYYMNSNNITMHKFGIENNYISMAMNSMLSKTNNTVKSMNISETNAMVVDYNWWCIISIIAVIAAFVLIQGIPGVNVTFDTMTAFYGYMALTDFVGAVGELGMFDACFGVF